ncbi:hypothetical protein cypCar_00015533 [Cyprinus carpio]|nr:hypothetical protein cypCar_00015533 [Cyprinus carpio]
MATDFTQDSVLRFIINNGGTVRNADLLTHYRRFLREDEEREQNRELFKRYVNSVATVRQEDGVSHVVLRKKYRVHLGDVAKNREPERDSKQAQAALTIPTRVEILPVAGILTNNDSTPSFEKAVRTSPPHGREQPSVSTSCEKQVNDTCPLKPTPSDTDSRSNGSGQSYEQQPWELKATREATEQEHNGVYVAKQRQLREADGCEQSFVNPAHCAYYEERDEYEPHGLFVDDPAMYLQIRRPSSLSSSRDSVSIPSPSSTPPDTGWPHDNEWSSDQGLVPGQDGNDSRTITPMHHSMGHLVDEDSRASTRSSSPETHRGPIVRRLTSRLRSRMCRSLGEDLDQPFPEDNISARHNRLQLLSSTLSMGNLVSQSSSRGQSSRELSSPAGSTRSLSTSVHDGSFSSKHSSIPLDPREHDWFVKAASGTWTDIYALFRDDPNLLSKRDFISGFTVVHWIAKHGDHRVLNTLWYGVNKVGMTLDVNAKTLGGYTPLHLAAIHGHKKLIRLLVQKFKADVRIRDSSGKRPWQYLSKDEQRDILELLGAPQKRISGSPAMPENLSTRPATTKGQLWSSAL